MSAERCEACGQPTVPFGRSVFPGECDGDCGCLETQLDEKCRRIARLEAQNAALRAVVEAARPIVKWTADNYGEGCGDELDHWDLALAALDRLEAEGKNG